MLARLTLAVYMYNISCSFLIGTTTKISLHSTQSELINSASVQLLNSTGETAVEATLERCNSSWTGVITTPSVGDYTYQIEGQDTSNHQFIYFTRRKVNFLSGKEYFHFASADTDIMTARFDDPIVLSFTLTSNNPFGSTIFQFEAENLDGFIVFKMPMQSVLAYGENVNITATLHVASSRIKTGLPYNFTVTASNGCTTLSASKTFVLTKPVSCN